jgi:hypothetical protein
MKNFGARKGIIVLAAVMLLFYAAWYGYRGAVRLIAETTETRMDIADLDGAHVQVTDTLVDAIAHSEYVSIYFSEPATSGAARLLHRKTLLFRYDPGANDAPLPSVTANGPKTIRVTVPRVSSVFIREKSWKGLSVDYQIGHIDYP